MIFQRLISSPDLDLLVPLGIQILVSAVQEMHVFFSTMEGMDAALDVTVASPLQATLVQKAAEEAGHALSHAYDRKFKQVGEECQQQGVKFLRLPVETLG